MYASQSMLIWLGCITPALTAIVTPKLVQPRATTGDTISATLDAQGDATVDTPQSVADLLIPHFDGTCSSVGKKRLGKRDLTRDDKACIAYSAFSLAIFAASNLKVQDAVSTIQQDFDVKGDLIDITNQVEAMIQQSSLPFSTRIFSPQSIRSTTSYFTTLAAYVWAWGSTEGINHIVLTLSETETAATKSCSSWTFSWTSPTLSKTTVPASPCVPIETGIAYEGTDPVLWASEISRYQAAFTAPKNLVPDDIICRAPQYWDSKCGWPSTKDDPNKDLESCITAFQDATKNPTWPLGGTMQPGSTNVSMPCSSNKGTVYFVLNVSWEPQCQAATSDGTMSVTNPTATSDSTSAFTLDNIMYNIYKGCLDFALFLDAKTRTLSQVPGSAGSGEKVVQDHPKDSQYSASTNNGEGGRIQIGCLVYEFFSSKNNDGINADMTPYVNGHEGKTLWPNQTAQMDFYKENWPTLGEKFYALNGGYGQYCPNLWKPKGPVYSCPAYPCYNFPAKGTPNIPPHDEFLVQARPVVNSNTTASNATSLNSTFFSAMSPSRVTTGGAAGVMPTK